MYPDGYILKAAKKVVAEKQKVCDVSKETSIQKELYWDMLKISWLLEFKMKLKQLQSLGVTKNLVR